jgi:hypothetical protein
MEKPFTTPVADLFVFPGKSTPERTIGKMTGGTIETETAFTHAGQIVSGDFH